MNNIRHYINLLRILVPALAFSIFVSCTNKTKTEQVKISERQLLVNDVPYLIKGICYHPVPKGSASRSFDSLTEDIALMVAAGINTIRVYSPIDDKAILDEINEAGIKIIVSFGYNQDGYYDMLSGTFIDYINTYKNHNAILLWELGNEFNYHPEWFNGDIKNWYSVLNESAKLVHQNDTNHQVASAHGELPNAKVLSSCPTIDIWGINVYRWDNPETIFNEWSKISSKPMYLSEAGADSYMTISKNAYKQGENENAQADATKNILDDVFGHRDICSGVNIFEFVDEWWKAGDNTTQNTGGWAPNSGGVPFDGTANEEYWGIVNLDRKTKKVYEVIKESYTSLKTP